VYEYQAYQIICREDRLALLNAEINSPRPNTDWNWIGCRTTGAATKPRRASSLSVAKVTNLDLPSFLAIGYGRLAAHRWQGNILVF
jgi:hypothetical protein